MELGKLKFFVNQSYFSNSDTLGLFSFLNLLVQFYIALQFNKLVYTKVAKPSV